MTEVWSAGVWSERAARYVSSDAHRAGNDIDLLVEWARGAGTALDVATGGGHVARRLREAGLEVTTCDSAHGMQPDVVCPAEDIPFADESFDLVVCRTAAHHFSDPRAAVREMARVARGGVLVVDTLDMGDDAEAAETLRDPSHVRNYTEREWRDFFAGPGLAVEEFVVLPHEIDFPAWLERTGCTGEDAARVRELWGERVVDNRLTLDKIAIRARKSG